MRGLCLRQNGAESSAADVDREPAKITTRIKMDPENTVRSMAIEAYNSLGGDEDFVLPSLSSATSSRHRQSSSAHRDTCPDRLVTLTRSLFRRRPSPTSTTTTGTSATQPTGTGPGPQLTQLAQAPLQPALAVCQLRRVSVNT